MEADPGCGIGTGSLVVGICGLSGAVECVVLQFPVLIEFPGELPFGVAVSGELQAADGDAEFELCGQCFASDQSVDVNITGFDADGFTGQSDDSFDEGFCGSGGVAEDDGFPASGGSDVEGVFVYEELIAVVIGQS